MCVSLFALQDDDLMASAGESEGDRHEPSRDGLTKVNENGIIQCGTDVLIKLEELGKLPTFLTKLALKPVRFGSVCSGLEVFTMCLRALAMSWAMLPEGTVPKIEILHEFSVEIDADKRALCKQISPNVKHVYSDACDLAYRPSWDDIEEKYTTPGPVDIVAAGFSCKDLSWIKNKSMVKFSGTSGTSIKTFSATVEIADAVSTAIIILENVKGLLAARKCDGGRRPIDLVEEQLRQRGYVGAHRLAKSFAFGVPQRRSRIWLIFFKVGFGDGVEAIGYMRLFERRAGPLHVHLISGTVLLKKKSTARVGDSWPKKCRAFAQAKGLKWRDVTAIKKLLAKDNTEFAKMTPRVQTNLAATLLDIKQNKKIDTTHTPVVIQADQDVPRQPWAKRMCPCITPRGAFWLASGPTSTHRFLDPRELASLQGVGPNEVAHFNLEHIPPLLLKDLAGNAFTGPVCMAAVVSSFLAWKRA